MLNSGADINAQNDEGITPLHNAASNGRLEVAKELIKLGADPNIQDSKGDTPLHTARSVPLIGTLVGGGANINTKNYAGITPLHNAVNNGQLELVEKFIELKADPNIQGNKGNTPLHDAVMAAAQRGGVLGTMEELITELTNIQKNNKNIPSALDLAGQSLSMIRTLVTGQADVTKKNEQGLSPLDIAINNPAPTLTEEEDTLKTSFQMQVIRTLFRSEQLNHLTEKDAVLLNDLARSTARRGDITEEWKQKLQELFINAGVSLPHATPQEMAIKLMESIHAAASKTNSAEERAVILASIREAIAQRADINYQDEYGLTPLHYAAFHDDFEIINILEENHALINTKDNIGNSPLHDAVSASAVATLISNGADVNAQNDEGITPLQNAVKNGHLEITKELIKLGADSNMQDPEGNSPLHVAAMAAAPQNVETLSMIEVLVTGQANVTKRNKDGLSPLNFAIMNIALSEIDSDGTIPFQMQVVRTIIKSKQLAKDNLTREDAALLNDLSNNIAQSGVIGEEQKRELRELFINVGVSSVHDTNQEMGEAIDTTTQTQPPSYEESQADLTNTEISLPQDGNKGIATTFLPTSPNEIQVKSPPSYSQAQSPPQVIDKKAQNDNKHLTENSKQQPYDTLPSYNELFPTGEVTNVASTKSSKIQDNQADEVQESTAISPSLYSWVIDKFSVAYRKVMGRRSSDGSLNQPKVSSEKKPRLQFLYNLINKTSLLFHKLADNISSPWRKSVSFDVSNKNVASTADSSVGNFRHIDQDKIEIPDNLVEPNTAVENTKSDTKVTDASVVAGVKATGKHRN